MKKVVKATIRYNITKDNPDFKYVESPEKPLVFTDTYRFSPESEFYDDPDYMMNFIKQDLLLVAGGGYDTKGVTNVKFEFKGTTEY